MSPPHRWCIFPGCHSVQSNDTVSFFKFPKDDNVRKWWIDFVKRSYCGELKITTNTCLGSVHSYIQLQGPNVSKQSSMAGMKSLLLIKTRLYSHKSITVKWIASMLQCISLMIFRFGTGEIAVKTKRTDYKHSDHTATGVVGVTSVHLQPVLYRRIYHSPCKI